MTPPAIPQIPVQPTPVLALMDSPMCTPSASKPPLHPGSRSGNIGPQCLTYLSPVAAKPTSGASDFSVRKFDKSPDSEKAVICRDGDSVTVIINSDSPLTEGNKVARKKELHTLKLLEKHVAVNLNNQYFGGNMRAPKLDIDWFKWPCKFLNAEVCGWLTSKMSKVDGRCYRICNLIF